MLRVAFNFREFIILGHSFADIKAVTSIKPTIYRLTNRQLRPPRSIFSTIISRDRRYRSRSNSISLNDYTFLPEWATDKAAVREAIKAFSTSTLLLFSTASVNNTLDQRLNTPLSPLSDPHPYYYLYSIPQPNPALADSHLLELLPTPPAAPRKIRPTWNLELDPPSLEQLLANYLSLLRQSQLSD